MKNTLFKAIASVSLVFLTTSTIVVDTKKTFEIKPDVEDISKVNQSSLKMFECLEKFSEMYNIPKSIFFNIAYLESRYRGPSDEKYKPNLTSRCGALGPMQIMPSTANYICKEKVSKQKLKNDIELNVEISAKVLRHLHDKYNDWALVCGYYNTGRPKVNKYAKFCVENEDYQKNWVQ